MTSEPKCSAMTFQRPHPRKLGLIWGAELHGPQQLDHVDVFMHRYCPHLLRDPSSTLSQAMERRWSRGVRRERREEEKWETCVFCHVPRTFPKWADMVFAWPQVSLTDLTRSSTSTYRTLDGDEFFWLWFCRLHIINMSKLHVFQGHGVHVHRWNQIHTRTIKIQLQ